MSCSACQSMHARRLCRQKETVWKATASGTACQESLRVAKLLCTSSAWQASMCSLVHQVSKRNVSPWYCLRRSAVHCSQDLGAPMTLRLVKHV